MMTALCEATGPALFRLQQTRQAQPAHRQRPDPQERTPVDAITERFFAPNRVSIDSPLARPGVPKGPL